MSTYGKHIPEKRPKALRRQAAGIQLSTNDDRGKRGLRRHATGLNQSIFGIQLSTNNDDVQSESTTDPGDTEVKTPRRVVKKSIKRLRNAIVPQVGGTHKTFRLLWMVIYLGLSAIFLFSLRKLVIKYLEYPTTSELTLEIDNNLTFPAVTVCNENPVRKSLISRYRKFSDFLLLDKYVANHVEMTIREFGDRNSATSCSGGKCITWTSWLNNDRNM